MTCGKVTISGVDRKKIVGNVSTQLPEDLKKCIIMHGGRSPNKLTI